MSAEQLVIDTASGQLGLFDEAEEYQAFTEKFKAKKTTDDCYTPENIHEAVMAWVEQEYGISREHFLRPFWPGEDYQAGVYPPEDVVVDNPPFSLRKQIVDFYMARGVRFFLYSPALTLLTRRHDVCHIAVGVSVTYENGAEVPTSFVTNLESSVLRTAPELYRAISQADQENRRALHRSLPKYIYPDHIVTAAIAQRWCKYGVDWSVSPSDCRTIGELDAQRAAGKSIFGYGLLLSERAAAERAAAERAAAERAAAERAAAERWKLSEREMQIVRALGADAKEEQP